MYTVYADSKCIYNDVSPSQKNKILNPKLILEDNSAGSFEFTIPASNPDNILVKRLLTDITVKRDGIEIWSGRVLDETGDFYNNRKVYCEGELAFFNDSSQSPAEYHDLSVRAFLETLVSVHNSQVKENRRFTVGAVTVEDNNDSLYRYTNYEKTIDCLKDKLLSSLGGHFVIRKENGVRYLDYLKDYPRTSTQQIHFGKNLLDFAKKYSMANFVTAIIPRGEMINGNEYSIDNSYSIGEYCFYNGYVWRCKVDITEGEAWTPSHWQKVQKYYEALTPYLTVEEVNNGSNIVAKKSLVDDYGVITQVVDWNDVTEPSVLLSKANEYLNKVNYDDLELEVSAVDLRLLGVDYDSIALLDRVRVISRPHGLNQLFPVRKMEIPLNAPENTQFTMSSKDELNDGISGSTAKSVSDLQKDLYQISNEMGNADNKYNKAIEAAKINASSLIKMATNGYITILQNENGTTELLITDEKDYTKARKIWRWNINGLGYSKDGGRTYGTAITMDGKIVADYITAGTMTGDRVKGGTFEVGGTGLAKDGKLLVKNSSGSTVGQWDKNGIRLYAGTVGGWYITEGTIVSYNNTDEASSTRKVVMYKYVNSDLNLAYAVYVRNSVSESWKRTYSVNFNGVLYCEHADFESGTIYVHDVWATNGGGISLNGGTVIHNDLTVNASPNIYGSIVANGLNTRTGTGRGIYSDGDIYARGGIGCGGSKPRIVHTKSFGHRQINAYETATPYFGDIGEGTIDKDGKCVIYIDEIFLETIDTTISYQVFLQKYGDGDLWVSERNEDNFVVNGTPNLKFGFEIKAIQKDYEGVRCDAPSNSMMELIEGEDNG